MRMCGLSQQSSNLGIQWHVIAMYAPGFFTGRLIARFGAQRVVMAGLAFTALSAATGLLGIDVAHFWLTLILLGMGWNFGFVGASALVLECHQPEEKASVQSLNDFIVFGTMAFGSFLSGDLLATYGWNTVLGLSFAPLALAVIALLGAAAASKRARRLNAISAPFNRINAPVPQSRSHPVEPGYERTGTVPREVSTPTDHN
jgi:MFS family permease